MSLRSVLRAAAAVSITLSTACARGPSERLSPETAQADGATRRVGANVFTDTALYRRVCLEADSGLTPASRRCTARDQSRRPEREPRPREP
jgi:hypothetical protein